MSKKSRRDGREQCIAKNILLFRYNSMLFVYMEEHCRSVWLSNSASNCKLHIMGDSFIIYNFENESLPSSSRDDSFHFFLNDTLNYF